MHTAIRSIVLLISFATMACLAGEAPAGDISSKLNSMFISAEENGLLVERQDLIYFYTAPRVEQGILCHSTIATLPGEFQKNSAAFIETYDGFQLLGSNKRCGCPPANYFKIRGDTELAVEILERFNALAICARTSGCELPDFANVSEAAVRQKLSKFEPTDIFEVVVSDVGENSQVRIASGDIHVASSAYIESGESGGGALLWVDELIAPQQ